ncbi:MAG: AMP-binding protein [Burkholderiaceae bacterium]|jgi:phenylacetate-CoA ligase|nr:AMP-binding protein [Burkholderiaceae bacterium]MDH5208179.1 AMP-binding protein [Burkholderiaceae bacterium]
MTQHLDARETRDHRQRELDLMGHLPGLLAKALKCPGWKRHLGDIDPTIVNTRAALARLPVMRKAELPALQKAQPPFGGLVPDEQERIGRLFTSPGPIYEPEGRQDDSWHAARGLYAAGFRGGDRVLNTFSYHLTPGGFIMDGGARALGCTVIPAGPGNTEQQLDIIEHLKPTAYMGTPDFLKILLDAARAGDRDASSIVKAALSGAAFPPSLQSEFRQRGIDAYQLYATADVGVIAYESRAREGLIVNEDILLEIVRPGTGDPVPDGEVGEVLVTSFDAYHPWVRLALGDLSAILSGVSPCGRSNTRIKGWMGRADQTAKVKGMFVRPEQVAEIARRHAELGRLRLVVTRTGETDAMTLKAESRVADAGLERAIGESLRSVMKLGGAVELLAPGSLPNDGKVIEDARTY